MNPPVGKSTGMLFYLFFYCIVRQANSNTFRIGHPQLCWLVCTPSKYRHIHHDSKLVHRFDHRLSLPSHREGAVVCRAVGPTTSWKGAPRDLWDEETFDEELLMALKIPHRHWRLPTRLSNFSKLFGRVVLTNAPKKKTSCHPDVTGEFWSSKTWNAWDFLRVIDKALLQPHVRRVSMIHGSLPSEIPGVASSPQWPHVASRGIPLDFAVPSWDIQPI